MTMTANDAAREIGTTAKILRRFLRDEPSYRNVGSGGRYTFTTSDMATLRKLFTRWAQGKKPAPRKVDIPRPVKPSQPDVDRAIWAEEDRERAAAGLGPIVVPPMTPDVRRAAQVRLAELERLIRTNGRKVST